MFPGFLLASPTEDLDLNQVQVCLPPFCPLSSRHALGTILWITALKAGGSLASSLNHTHPPAPRVCRLAAGVSLALETSISHTHRLTKEISALVTSQVFTFASILDCCKNIPASPSSLAHQLEMACRSPVEEELISRHLFRPLLFG